jgi:hypothetical protein
MPLIYYLSNVSWNIPNKVVCHAHLNHQIDKVCEFNGCIKYFTPFTRKNDKSKIMIHPDKGHILHWYDAPKIIESIMLLLNYK